LFSVRCDGAWWVRRRRRVRAAAGLRVDERRDPRLAGQVRRPSHAPRRGRREAKLEPLGTLGDPGTRVPWTSLRQFSFVRYVASQAAVVEHKLTNFFFKKPGLRLEKLIW